MSNHLRSRSTDRPNRRKVDANDTVPPRRPFLAGSRKTVKAMRNAHVLKAGGLKRRQKLCSLQSTGDSTGPQVDVAERTVGQLFTDDDIGHLQMPARFQDARHLCDRAILSRNEVENAV